MLGNLLNRFSFKTLHSSSYLIKRPVSFFSKVAQSIESAEEMVKKIRNIAIIAHVDHGKTTLVDTMLRFGGVDFSQQCAMDSNQLQREKGITILSKCTNINYNGYQINIVDTPGHHDFGGEVERIMGMVDGVCLIICATEGPMTQTKFVLRKALQRNIKPLVVINKVDRPSARVSQVVNEVFEMFCDLQCPDHYLEYPIYYASGKNGWAVENLGHQRVNIECVLKGIINNIPHPVPSKQKAFSMLVTQTSPNSYFGRMLLGRINSGVVEIGKQLKTYDQDGKLIDMGKVTKISKKTGLSEIQLTQAIAGDIVSIAGFPNSKVTHTLVEETFPEKVIPCLKIDEPLMGVTINVNTSPFAGKEGSKLTLNDLKVRFKDEAENDVALFVSAGQNTNSIIVRGRGDLHIGLLLEKIRREGYEFSVTPPEIVFKEDPKTKELLQPVEKIIFEIEDRFTALILDKMNHRKGTYLSSETKGDKTKMEFLCTTRALIGIRTELLNETQGTALIRTSFQQYKPYSGPLKKNPKGALISMCDGVTTPYSLKEVEKFGTLFIKAGQRVYNGLVIGENNKEEDLQVNPTKQKKLTNVRTHAHDEKIMLVPPKIMSIEEAICYLRDDQLLEVTPKQVRIRKKQLDKNGRDRVRREKKNELKNFKQQK